MFRANALIMLALLGQHLGQQQGVKLFGSKNLNLELSQANGGLVNFEPQPPQALGAKKSRSLS